MVDPKLILVIVKSEKQKKKNEEEEVLGLFLFIFQNFWMFTWTYERLLPYIISLHFYLHTFAHTNNNFSLPKMCQMIGPFFFFFIPDRFQRCPTVAPAAHAPLAPPPTFATALETPIPSLSSPAPRMDFSLAIQSQK